MMLLVLSAHQSGEREKPMSCEIVVASPGEGEMLRNEGEYGGVRSI